MQTITLKEKAGEEIRVLDRVDAVKMAVERAVNEHWVSTEDILAVDALELKDHYEVTIYLKGPVAVQVKIPKNGEEPYSEVIELSR